MQNTDQWLTCCVEIHIDDPQYFPLHINLDSRMLDKILYVVDKRDMPL